MGREKQVNRVGDIMIDLFDSINKEEEIWVSRLSKNKLSISEIHTLVAIGKLGSTAMTNIARQLRITISTLTIAINRLEKRGLVERVRDESDKRVINIRLTEKGNFIVEKHNAVHSRMVGRMVEELNDEEVDVLEKTMEKMLIYFTKRR